MVRHPLARAGWKLAGYGLVLLGFVGMALPVMPTTIFWILGAVCLLRAGDRRVERLLAHPRFGGPVRLFLETGAVSRQGKGIALSGMTLAAIVLSPLVLSHPAIFLLAGLGLTAAAAWVATRPEPVSARVRSRR
ncbi:DUF454 domain-containing protein [Aerophototrophica crusticola]|uniref:DUF454 domain-containing protein n=1 Tax=Aerophototrophica crusticola TaxID=1709002 RepID=A0A858RBH8_9PROT|nr:DUF454 domain-containing protein [Rhodospirillaceae bacterium B3]